jgi:hypothetical protein
MAQQVDANQAFSEAALRFIVAVDALRRTHEASEDCLCWYEALHEQRPDVYAEWQALGERIGVPYP